jgi:hypothetical protein
MSLPLGESGSVTRCPQPTPVSARGIRREVGASPAPLQLRSRPRCPSPLSTWERLRTLRVPALVTLEPCVSATPPPSMVTWAPGRESPLRGRLQIVAISDNEVRVGNGYLTG